MVEEKFKVRIEKYENEINLYKKSSDRIGYLRLVTAIGAGYYIYKLFKEPILVINIVISSLLLLFFIGLIIYHGKIKEKIQAAEVMIDINNKYLKRISGEWVTFKDIGSEFVDRAHPYSFDLDIVGQESIFQLINITSTWKGRNRLAKVLLDSNFSAEDISKRQKAVDELKDKLELCQFMEYEGKRKSGALESPEKLLAFIKDKNKLFKNKVLKKFLYYMPMVTISVSMVIVVFKLSYLYDLITIFLVLQLLAWAAGLMRISRAFAAISYFKGALEDYEGILKLLENQKFETEMLRDIYGSLFNKDKSAASAIKELTRIAEKIDMRNNGFFFMVLNGLFLWDYQCIFSIESWKEKYSDIIEYWLDTIGEVEALMSISVLNHISDEVTFPIIEEEPMIFEAEDLGHPLISKKARVNNSIKMSRSILIITGSNMSGKTTFLRTIGINLVIAYCGGAVYSKKMRCSKMNMYTSMRITDDLKAGISTFYGELIRIKEIIEGASRQENMIFLIDEIFRGTNSRDRIEGALAVIKNLNREGVMGAITTHDLELCVLEKSERIRNFHFKEYYKDNKIYFDYKLKSGVSKTTNAKYLMKIVGIEL
ncbi:MutS family DNA mismatch repair protein [Clostridium culturomicium]|uniref:MutS family DNA mismatch repair protein n=1 Tax=Clostridium culturomicium TaxID=1499683 RepID=UPI00058D7766|nr:MutS family DNA mismatch repair protein [Clostridium culturomicium]